MTMNQFCFSTETWCTMACASPRRATNPWKWCKGEVLAAKPNPGAAKDQRTGEENYFECSRCSYKCIVHTFVLLSCLDLSSQRFSYETWKRIAANILTTVMKIGTVFVQKPLTRLLLSDCCLKVYILYPTSLFPGTNDRSSLVWALPCHFHTKCYYSTASLTLLLWSQPAHFSLYWLQQHWSPENTILTLKREREREREPSGAALFLGPHVSSVKMLCKSGLSLPQFLPLYYHQKVNFGWFLKNVAAKHLWKEWAMPYFPLPLPNNTFCIWTLLFLSSNHSPRHPRNSWTPTITFSARPLTQHWWRRWILCCHSDGRTKFHLTNKAQYF